MDKLPIDEVIPYLDCKDINKHSVALQIVTASMSESEQVLNLLVEQYYVSYSDNILRTIMSVVTESRARRLFDAVHSELTRALTDNLKPSLDLLTNLASKRDPEPTWMYLIVGHDLLNEILARLQGLDNCDNTPLGLAFISMLLPLAPVRLSSMLDELLTFLSSALSLYQNRGDKSWEYVQRLCFHYLVTLYSIYPVRLVKWAQTLPLDSPSSTFMQKYGLMLKLHPTLLQHPDLNQEVIGDRESHDIVWEASCYSENLDLLHEAKMLDDIKQGEITELHDISWESTDSVSRSVACQTRDPRASTKVNNNKAVSDNLINTYLDKTLSASAGLYHHRRKSSYRFQHDSSESSNPAIAVLQGELMLEKYLRFQHERRNRRYLSQVRQCQEERSHNQYYRDRWDRLNTELRVAEEKVAELTQHCEMERLDTQQQLMAITERLNREMIELRSKNSELEKSTREDSTILELLQSRVTELTQARYDVQSVNRLLREKEKQLDVVNKQNDALSKKTKQLENQLFVVNEIRSYQCDALNALKPFCFKTKNIGPYSGPTKDTPDIVNLTKLAAETVRKHENTESEVNRLRSMNTRQEQQIVGLREKLNKQKDLTEKTTNFWEQKYSGLERTCATYKNTYSELCQKVLRLKRELEHRPYC